MSYDVRYPLCALRGYAAQDRSIMISCDLFFETLKNEGLEFFTGVPDSLLSSLSAWLIAHTPERHIIAANEGNAVGIAAGYHLATGKIPVVYMQNSGIGNTVNPVASLLHRDVYQIPALFLVGWRGEPGVHDEPQHVFQGKATVDMLEAMDVPAVILEQDWEKAREQLLHVIKGIRENGTPAALVIHKNTFESVPLAKKDAGYPMSRERALEVIADNLLPDGRIVSTTGKLSRELFEIRERRGEGHEKDFLTVGSMGHASSIALGVARETNRPVYCLDGDGAVLMHMGAMAVIGQSGISNLKHIVINNGCHESVGGQPTVGLDIRMDQIALACGYERVYTCTTEEELAEAMKSVNQAKQVQLIQVLVNTNSRKDLGRPTVSSHENKQNFMNSLCRDV